MVRLNKWGQKYYRIFKTDTIMSQTGHPTIITSHSCGLRKSLPPFRPSRGRALAPSLHPMHVAATPTLIWLAPSRSPTIKLPSLLASTVLPAGPKPSPSLTAKRRQSLVLSLPLGRSFWVTKLCHHRPGRPIRKQPLSFSYTFPGLWTVLQNSLSPSSKR